MTRLVFAGYCPAGEPVADAIARAAHKAWQQRLPAEAPRLLDPATRATLRTWEAARQHVRLVVTEPGR